MLGFVAINATILCGLTAAPLWTVAASTLALASFSYGRHVLLFRRAADLGLQDGVDQTILGSLVNCLAASAMAYGSGAVFRYLSLG